MYEEKLRQCRTVIDLFLQGCIGVFMVKYLSAFNFVLIVTVYQNYTFFVP